MKQTAHARTLADIPLLWALWAVSGSLWVAHTGLNMGFLFYFPSPADGIQSFVVHLPNSGDVAFRKRHVDAHKCNSCGSHVNALLCKASMVSLYSRHGICFVLGSALKALRIKFRPLPTHSSAFLTSEFVPNGKDGLQAYEPSNFVPAAHCQLPFRTILAYLRRADTECTMVQYP